MVYNNFILRILFSIILIIIFLISIKSVKYIHYLGIFIYFLILIEVIKNFKNNKYLIFIYLFISFVSFNLYILYFYIDKSFYQLIYTVIIFDTSCYLVGSYIGKNIMFQKISPKKTYEGLIGGILITNLIYFLFLEFFLSFDSFEINFFLLNLLIFSSFIGDLLQSIFKRNNFLKESSNFLPGHGGFFDRFDSFLFSIIFLFIYELFYL
jgi:phosphatidate cytidylyltransferase